MILVDTFVAGQPKTKGSMVVRPNKTLANSPASSHWRALMAGAVRDDHARRWALIACRGERDGAGMPLGCDHWAPLICGVPQPFTGPVLVEMLAILPGDPLAYGAGDLDKLLRNVLDALGTKSQNPRYNGGVIVDDNQVTQIKAGKAGPLPAPGCHIRVTALG